MRGRAGVALGALLALGLVTCQPKRFEPTPTAGQAHVEGVRLGDVPVRIVTDEANRTAFEALVRELSMRGVQLRQDDSATTRIDLTARAELGEGYRLEVTPGRIRILGDGPAGTFYGVMDLLRRAQPFGPGRLRVPLGVAVERPFFAYRGMHLDVARHFFGTEEVKTLIDRFASLRFNTLHLHLSDDHGFALKFPQAPELLSNPEEFYDAAAIADLVHYAQDRFVTIVPELDVPGHTMSWLAPHPELACPVDPRAPFSLPSVSGNFEEILCAGNPDARAFVKARYHELFDMFPGAYVHMGGDEVLMPRWHRCPRCQARRRELGAPTDTALYSDFVSDITRVIQDADKIAIGWDETAEVPGGPDTVMVWRDETQALSLAQHGKRVILTPYSHAYFNIKHRELDDGPGETGGLPWQKVAGIDWRPLTARAPAGSIWGGQGALWTEKVKSLAEAERLLFPRTVVLAEVLWHGHFRHGTGAAGAAWLAERLERLAEAGVRFDIPPPEGFLQRRALVAGAAEVPVQVSFAGPAELPGAEVLIQRGTTEAISDGAERGSITLTPGDNPLQALTLWRDRRSDVVRTRFVVEPPHPAQAAPAVAKPGCRIAMVAKSGVQQLPELGAWARRGAARDLCDPVGVLRGRPGASFTEGRFEVPSTGVWRFALRSDDGARLRVDDLEVVSHDGIHAASSRHGEIVLEAGWHRYALEYFDAGGEAMLSVVIGEPGAAGGRSLFDITHKP